MLQSMINFCDSCHLWKKLSTFSNPRERGGKRERWRVIPHSSSLSSSLCSYQLQYSLSIPLTHFLPSLLRPFLPPAPFPNFRSFTFDLDFFSSRTFAFRTGFEKTRKANGAGKREENEELGIRIRPNCTSNHNPPPNSSLFNLPSPARLLYVFFAPKVLLAFTAFLPSETFLHESRTNLR